MRKRNWQKRGSATVALIGVGVMLCVVLLGGILGQLTKMNNQPTDQTPPPASDTPAEPSDSTTNTPITTETTPPEDNTDGFKISISCIEEDQTILDVENPNEIQFEYRFTVDGDEVELKDDDISQEETTEFRYEQVIARYYEENISEQGCHRARSYNIKLEVVSDSLEDYVVWQVRDFCFHDFDIKDNELTIVDTQYDPASTGNETSLEVEFHSKREGRNCYLIRYEVDGQSREAWAQKEYGTPYYTAYLGGYTNPEEIENPVLYLVKGDGEEIELTIGTPSD